MSRVAALAIGAVAVVAVVLAGFIRYFLTGALLGKWSRRPRGYEAQHSRHRADG